MTAKSGTFHPEGTFYMSYKIVSDSSCNQFHLDGIDYATVPLKIRAGDREFIDNEALDVEEMVTYLKRHKGKSGSSCPNVQEWLDAFAGADNIIAMTISGPLSGSYASARNAAAEYMEEHPGSNVFVLDTQATGPEMCMLMDKVKEWAAQELPFKTLVDKLVAYHKEMHTLFCLESLTNLARNGRISPAVATIAGVLGIRVCGDVEQGQITPLVKPRGQKKATEALLKLMQERGLTDGETVRIAHCFGEANAQMLKDKVLSIFPKCKVLIEQTTALCSYYAEEGGMIIGFHGSRHLTKY